MNELLRNLYLFRGLDAESLHGIDDIARLRSFKPGERIFSQQAEAVALFVIQHGTVNVEQTLADGSKVEIATLGTGSHFGEMAFLDGLRRSTSATAATPSDIIEIGYEDLRRVLDADARLATHVYRELARFLCGRLRLTTMDLSNERHRNLSHL